MKERERVMREIWGIFGEMEIDNIEGISPAKAINKILNLSSLAVLSDDQNLPSRTYYDRFMTGAGLWAKEGKETGYKDAQQDMHGFKGVI